MNNFKLIGYYKVKSKKIFKAYPLSINETREIIRYKELNNKKIEIHLTEDLPTRILEPSFLIEKDDKYILIPSYLFNELFEIINDTLIQKEKNEK